MGTCFAGRESHLGDRVCDNGDAFSLQLQCHSTIWKPKEAFIMAFSVSAPLSMARVRFAVQLRQLRLLSHVPGEAGDHSETQHYVPSELSMGQLQAI